MIKRVSDKTLKEQAYAAIKEAILKNELAPGDDIAVSSLADELGISSTPVREAMLELSKEKLVTSLRNQKAQIAKVTEKDIADTYEVRRLLEPYAIVQTFNSISKDRIDALISDIEEIFELTGEAQLEAFRETDLQLHNLMVQALKNEILNEVFSFIHNYSLRIRFLAESDDSFDKQEVILAGSEEHLSIARAMASRDAQRVEEVVRTHLTNAEKRTKSTFH